MIGAFQQIREYFNEFIRSLDQWRASERLAKRVKENDTRASRVRSMSITIKVVP